MCDSEYDERGLPIGAYDNIKTSEKKESSSGSTVFEKVETSLPEYVTPEHAAWMKAMKDVNDSNLNPNPRREDK